MLFTRRAARRRFPPPPPAFRESQRAWFAAEVANVGHGGDRKSDQIKAPIGGLISQDTAADMLTVGRRSVQRAKKVKDEAVPELQDAVRLVVVLRVYQVMNLSISDSASR